MVRNQRLFRISAFQLLVAFAAALLAAMAPAARGDVPATRPQFDYKPGVDAVMNLLRDPTTLQSAEVIIRGFPEEALPIVRSNLAGDFSNLPPDVRAEVSRIVDRNHLARAHAKALVDDTFKWNVDSLRDSYFKVGLHDPSWDTAAIDAMSSVAHSKPDLKLFEKAQAEGCKDPLFLYFQVRALQLVNGGRYNRRLDSAADALMASNYPASRKCFALLNAARADFPNPGAQTPLTQDQRQALQTRLDTALTLYPQACSEPGMSIDMLAQLGGMMFNGYYKLSGDRGKAIDTVCPVLAAALPNSTIPLDLKGQAYIEYAWDARGSGWASTVTDQGMHLMLQRLQIARDTLVDACNKDSFDYVAPTAMLSVVLGDGAGLDEEKKWFIKALEANPDNRPAYKALMYFLEPKWYGDEKAMLNFGYECVSTQNFAAGIPLELASGYDALSRYQGANYAGRPQPQYFRDTASAWPDICACFVPTLQLYPDDYHERSLFARYAVWCGQYDEARQQFQILGDHAELKVFGSQLEFNKLVSEANNPPASTQP